MHEPIIESLAAGPEVFADLLHGPSAAPPPGEWSRAEIFGHVRAADAIWTPRILFALVHDGITMPDVDERALQAVLDAGGLDVDERLSAFTSSRRQLCAALRSLTDEQWERTVAHAERGPMTIVDACRALAEHEAEHIGQARGQ